MNINATSAYANQFLSNSIATESEPNELIEFSTYFGSPGDELGISEALHYMADTVVDSQGNIVVVGRSAAADFPVESAYQDSNSGSIDATVSKFSPDGTLIFSTYLGGSDADWANCVTLDSSDNIIIGGVTGSEDFPLKNPFQDTCYGGSESDADCFITKLSSDGQTLLYSSYFGGHNSDWCYAISVDSSNRIAFTGTTFSGDLPMVNANQSSLTGALDSFVVVLSSTGQSIVFSSFIGTPAWDAGRGIAFDSNGDVLVTGQLGMSSLGTVGVYQKNYAGGGADAYLAKFKLDGTLTYFSYLGGSAYDRANDLVIDSEDNIIITGYTQSTNFPTLNAFQNFTGGSYDMFVTKINSNGETIAYSSYLGGSLSEIGYGIAVDSADNVLITGEAISTNIPVYYDFNCTNGKSDCLLAKFKTNGDLLFSAVIGGSELDLGADIAVCANNDAVIVGFTLSSNFPTKNAHQDTYGGACDLFLLRVETVDMDIDPIVKVTETPTTSTEESTIELVSILLVTLPIAIFVMKKKKEKGSD